MSVCVRAKASNLSRPVSRGGGEEAAVWRDVAGEDGPLMSLHVLKLLPTFRVPHLTASNEDMEIVWHLL